MFPYIFKRLLAIFPIVFVLSFLTLFLIQLAPGNYFDQMRLNPQVSPEVIAQYEAKFHINQNVVVQYFYWLGGIFRFDFGYSFAYQQPVSSVIGTRLWNTFILSLVSFLLSWLVAIPLGIFAALRKGGFLDRCLCGLAYILISTPGFLLAIVFLYVFANHTTLPVGGTHSLDFDAMNLFEKTLDLGKHMLLPLLALSAFSCAYLFRLMRANVLEAASQDFIRVLRARGMPPHVIRRHIFRNAVNPLVTLFGLELPALFSGAALIEIMTGWPGLGQMMLQAVRTQDIFLVMGNIVMISVLLIIGNLISDILLAMVDPRVRRGLHAS